MKLKYLFITALLSTLLTSCSSVKIQSQRSPAAAGPVSVRYLVVVALDERPELRARFENEFVAQWKVANVKCTASHERFKLADFAGDREEVRRKLTAASVETVLVVRATDRITSVEGSVAPVLYAGELTWADVDTARYQMFTSGGEITTRLVVSGKLFRVGDGALLWSSFTETTLGENYDQHVVVRKVAGAIAGQLRRDKIFH